MMRQELSIVLIAHNEEKVVGKLIDGLLANYREKILEIVDVDDVFCDSLVLRGLVSLRLDHLKLALLRGDLELRAAY